MRHWPKVMVVILAMGMAAAAQETTQAPQETSPPAETNAYQPKFPGDPAHSQAEALALGYMRTVVRAEELYYKQHHSYTTSLATLAGHGSFTKRMVNPNRGDYIAHFHSNGKEYSLELEPKQFDAQHRSFFVNDSGVIRGEENKVATENSPPLPKK